MQSPTSDAPVLAAPLLSVAHAHAWADLAAVFEPWCNIVHLRRSLPAALAAEAARLGAACWSELRVTLAADTEEGPLAAAPLHAALLARGVPGLDALAADLLVLAEVPRELTCAEAIGVRLSRLVDWPVRACTTTASGCGSSRPTSAPAPSTCPTAGAATGRARARTWVSAPHWISGASPGARARPAMRCC